ncbi:serine hydroxymethyltransferase [Nocardia niigatensis]
MGMAIEQSDPEVFNLLEAEKSRQQRTITMIASENHVSRPVLEAIGTVLTDKYSEGYPGRRYYEGQQVIDLVETLALNRAKSLFGTEWANVQAHSGSPANLAVYSAFIGPGDTILGMNLAMGGHLTHGHKVSITGKWFQPVQYGLDLGTGRIDYDQVRDLALEHRPKIIICGGTALPRNVDFAAFRAIADEVDAQLHADISHVGGLIAAGVHPSPIGVADTIMTTTHKTLRGPRGALIMADAERGKKIDRAVFPGMQGGPHNNTTAGIAVALGEAAQPAFRAYGEQIIANSQLVCQRLAARGLDLVSGGSDNHLIVVDLQGKGDAVDGRMVAEYLDTVGIVTNYNTVPGDPRPPARPSGIRLGTAALTSRGLGSDEVTELADIVADAVDALAKNDTSADLESIRGRVETIARAHPLPSDA